MFRFVPVSIMTTLMVVTGAATIADEPAPSSKMVAVELVIAEFTVSGQADGAASFAVDHKNVTDQLKELVAQGKVGCVTRMHLTALDQMETTVSIGEMAPVVTGRTRFGGGFPGNTPREERAAGGPVTQSYSMVNVGTQVNLTPKVEGDGGILINLNVQRSRLAPKAARAEGAAGEEPQRTVNVSTKSTIRVVPRHPVLMSGAKNIANDETTELLVIVSAHVVDGTKPAR